MLQQQKRQSFQYLIKVQDKIIKVTNKKKFREQKEGKVNWKTNPRSRLLFIFILNRIPITG